MKRYTENQRFAEIILALLSDQKEAARAVGRMLREA
jgi:hypothetical protein